MLLENLKSILRDPPPAMAFEISEAGIAVARIGARAELDFEALAPGTLAISPLKENVVDSEAFERAVFSLAGTQSARKHKDVAVILPDFAARIGVLDFDEFPGDVKEQAALIRFRLKRSVPFDVESAALSYVQQTAGRKKVEVVVVMAPLEIVSRYEAPFRAAGMNPGWVTMSSIAALELAPESGITVVAKMTGHVLTVLVRVKSALRLVRCIELPSADLSDIVAVLLPTFVYIEDNLGGAAEKLLLCGFGSETSEAERRFGEELGVAVEPMRSPLATPGENNAGLLGYLRSIGRNN